MSKMVSSSFSWGRRAWFQCMVIPSPISQSDNAVGKSPEEPQGVPLSTRTRPGSPQEVKAPRSWSWTCEAGTEPQAPRGENRGPEDRTAALVGQPEPAHFLMVLDSDMFFRIHLPGLVGHGRTGEVDPLPAGAGDRPARTNQR